MLAQEWFYGLMTRPNMSIKVERKLHDMRIWGEDCESAKHGTIRMVAFFVYEIITLCDIG